MSLTLLQHEHRPDRWRRVLDHIHAAVDDGLRIKGQVAVRPVALIFSFALSLCPFSGLPSYDALDALPAEIDAARAFVQLPGARA